MKASDNETTKDTRSSYKDHHRRKYCPIPGCRAGPQLRLAWHIKQQHSHISRARRLQLTRDAQVLEQKRVIKRPKNTPTLETLFARQGKKQSQPSIVKVGQEQVRSTRNFPAFPKDNPKVMNFCMYLKSLDGGRKNESEVAQISADVSKFLKFARPTASDPVWQDLLDDGKVSAYLDFLQDSWCLWASWPVDKAGPHTTWPQVLAPQDPPSQILPLATQTAIMEERIKQWKTTIRPAKKKRQQIMDDQRDQLKLKEAVEILRSKQMKLDLDDVFARAVTGRRVNEDDLKLALAAVMTRLLYRSWQRPGAAKNAMLDWTFRAARRIPEPGRGMLGHDRQQAQNCT